MQRLTPRKTESIRSAYKARRRYGAIKDSLDRTPTSSAKRLFRIAVVIVVLASVFYVLDSTLYFTVASTLFPTVVAVLLLTVLVILYAHFRLTRALGHIENARFSCPRCHVFIPPRESWYCPGCEKTNPTSVNPYEFLDRCPSCRYELTLYRCPHCPKEIALSHRPDHERVAFNPERAKLPSKPATLEQKLQQKLEEHRLREAHTHIKQVVTGEEKLRAHGRWRMLEKTELADLAQKLEAGEIDEEEHRNRCNQVIQFIAMNSTID